jgi:predicted metal-binding protein
MSSLGVAFGGSRRRRTRLRLETRTLVVSLTGGIADLALSKSIRLLANLNLEPYAKRLGGDFAFVLPDGHCRLANCTLSSVVSDRWAQHE